jgi:integrase
VASIKRQPSGRWVARWRTPDGQSRKRAFRLKAEAEQFLTTVEADKMAGSYLDTSTLKVTLAEWWARYDVEVPRRATTAARDRAVMGKWWLPALGARRLASITPADVRRVMDAMTDKPLAPTTIRTNLGVFRAVMTRAVEAELIARSPVRGIRLPPEHRPEPRFLSPEELHRLAESMPEEYRPMVFIAGVLGLRWSEVAGLRVGRIDFLRRTVSVIETTAEVEGRLMEKAPVKSKASLRTITAPTELLDMLAEHLARCGRHDPDALVFVAPDGGPLRAGNFRSRVFQPAVSLAGLDGLTFHGLRHSAVGFMIALGAHPRVIQRRAGHASYRTTMDVYGRVLPDVDEDVGAGLGAVVAPTTSTPRVHSVSNPGPDPSANSGA